MGKTILEMKRVTKTFPGVRALNDISLSINEGEILGICGENGAGKSTLMKVLSGSYAHGEYEGEIWMDGKPAVMESVRSARRLGIEMVYQEVNMMLDMSVAENLFVGSLPAKGQFVQYDELYEKTRQALERIHLDVPVRSRVRELGVGQLQMLSIMRAICNNPRIVVFDEPTSALTDSETETLMGFMRELKENGVSSVFITHRLEELFRVCDRVVVMRDGEMVSDRPIAQANYDLLVQEMVGRKIENMYPKNDGSSIGEVALTVSNLTMPHPQYPLKNVVDGVSFSVRKGEILGLGGLVGSGRSEILEAIFGMHTGTAKLELTVNGSPVRIKSPRDAIRHGLGFVTENRAVNGLFLTMPILTNLTIAALKSLPGKIFINKKVEQEQGTRIFDELRIKAPSVETNVLNLSGGNQQKVVLGKWLLKRPEILLVDEPTKGIDVGAKVEFYKLLNELAASGVAIVMVSSDLPELVSMSDRCIVVSKGKITGEFTGKEITQENVMKAAIAE